MIDRKYDVSTTCYIERHQLAALKALSQQTGVPVAHYIRQGIDKILDMTAKGEDPFHGNDQPTAQDG